MSFRPYAIPAVGVDGLEALTVDPNPGNTVEVQLSNGKIQTGVLVKLDEGLVVMQCRSWFGSVNRVVLERSSVESIRRLSR